MPLFIYLFFFWANFFHHSTKPLVFICLFVVVVFFPLNFFLPIQFSLIMLMMIISMFFKMGHSNGKKTWTKKKKERERDKNNEMINIIKIRSVTMIVYRYLIRTLDKANCFFSNHQIIYLFISKNKNRMLFVCQKGFIIIVVE